LLILRVDLELSVSVVEHDAVACEPRALRHVRPATQSTDTLPCDVYVAGIDPASRQVSYPAFDLGVTSEDETYDRACFGRRPEARRAKRQRAPDVSDAPNLKTDESALEKHESLPWRVHSRLGALPTAQQIADRPFTLRRLLRVAEVDQLKSVLESPHGRQVLAVEQTSERSVEELRVGRIDPNAARIVLVRIRLGVIP